MHSLLGKVYINNGDGTFEPIKQIDGARVAKFADINNDGIPDLVASGTADIGNADSTFSKVYVNSINSDSQPPQAPNALTALRLVREQYFLGVPDLMM